MALVSENERNDAVNSPSITEEANSTKRQHLTKTLTSPSSLPTLTFDLIIEILTRLPVKLLLQLRCVCKSWNSLISDPKFAKKHLSHSTTHSLHSLRYSNNQYVFNSYSLDSVLTNVTTIDDVAKPQYPWNNHVYFVGSSNGILCFAHRCDHFFMVHLWNPSIRKFKELPFLEKPQHRFRRSVIMTMYGFGFDPVSDNYKVVVVLPEFDDIIGHRNVLKVHTLGTDSWKTISVFSNADNCIQRQGKYVSGTINWLVSVDIDQGQCSIASIDLRNECYQEILLPNYFKLNLYMHLSVFRDCLCLIYGEDVWVMKEYGNKESWTRLFTISNMRDSLTPSYPYIRAEYVFEDQVLIDTIDPESIEQKYICYNFRNGTSKLIEFEKTLEVCVESLISSCF